MKGLIINRDTPSYSRGFNPAQFRLASNLVFLRRAELLIEM